MQQIQKLFVAFTIAMMMLATGIEAQTGPVYDHIKCYKVGWQKGKLQVSTHVVDPLDLTPYQVPPFSAENGCSISPKPILFCIPVDKQPRQAPLGTDLKSDYFVYKMKCLPEIDFLQSAGDQFVRGEMLVKRKTTARLLMVPAYKTETPPDQCDSIAPHTCGGSCPFGRECRPNAIDVCECQDVVVTTTTSTTTTSLLPQCEGSAPTCDGPCPNPAEACVPVLGTTICRCESLTPPTPCGFDPNGQCGGDLCPAGAKCEIRFDPIANLDVCGCF